MTKEQLAEIVNKHSAWLRGEETGRRADLQGADLQGADLQGADLQGAYLYDAYLKGAYLKGAYLKGANLQGANLQGADLQGAYLYDANLKGANLQGAYLQGAYLKGAYLQRANGAQSQIVHTINITGSAHDILWFETDQINIGCEQHTISEWLEKYEEIGEKHGYSEEQVAEYKSYIDFIASVWKAQTK